MMPFYDHVISYISLGEVGVVCQDSLVKLENWEEGGYTINDKVGPRGEIIISGGGVSKGYYKCDNESDNAAFYTDTQGTSWFRFAIINSVNFWASNFMFSTILCD